MYASVFRIDLNSLFTSGSVRSRQISLYYSLNNYIQWHKPSADVGHVIVLHVINMQASLCTFSCVVHIIAYMRLTMESLHHHIFMLDFCKPIGFFCSCFRMLIP